MGGLVCFIEELETIKAEQTSSFSCYLRTQDTDGIRTKTQYKVFWYVVDLEHLGGKKLDIVDSSMFYTCDVDRT